MSSMKTLKIIFATLVFVLLVLLSYYVIVLNKRCNELGDEITAMRNGILKGKLATAVDIYAVDAKTNRRVEKLEYRVRKLEDKLGVIIPRIEDVD